MSDTTLDELAKQIDEHVAEDLRVYLQYYLDQSRSGDMEAVRYTIDCIVELLEMHAGIEGIDT